MRRRLIYLKYILNRNETSLFKNFLYTQMENPRKKDWITKVKQDLENLDIRLTMKEIEEMPKETYKKIIKKSIKESSFLYLNDKRIRRNGKGIEMEYVKLEMQNYLNTLDIDITNEERKIIFQLRNKMHFLIKTHFRNMHANTQCEGCKKESLTTKHALECQSLLGKNELVTYLPFYQDLYGEDEEEQVYIARIVRNNLKRLTQLIEYC